MTDEVTAMDLARLEEAAAQAEGLRAPTRDLSADAGETTGVPNTRWGQAAQTAYVGFTEGAREATRDLAEILPEQARVIRAYVQQEREIQVQAKQDAELLGGDIPRMPKPEPDTGLRITPPKVGGDGMLNI